MGSRLTCYFDNTTISRHEARPAARGIDRCCPVAIHAQIPSAEFEVVSVKPIPATIGGSAVPIVLPGRIEYHGATLKNLIAGAYQSQVTMIVEGPGYARELNDYRFNVEAKT